MARQIRKSDVIKFKIKRFHLQFFWQLIIAFVLVITLVGGGMSLAGRAALNRLAHDKIRAMSLLWAGHLADYYEQQSGWVGVDALIAGYPCGAGWEP